QQQQRSRSILPRPNTLTLSCTLPWPILVFQFVRGSNVSLVLDMSALGSVEPLSSGVVTPRERATQEYLQSASRVLSRQQLCDITLNTQMLHAEFAVSNTQSYHDEIQSSGMKL
uniref:protein-tyrosine-phosphatase n=1 Tax=Sinocyclocheilus rhinocerous TaxID=307959 RepID=A0A673N0Q9_9TELE